MEQAIIAIPSLGRLQHTVSARDMGVEITEPKMSHGVLPEGRAGLEKRAAGPQDAQGLQETLVKTRHVWPRKEPEMRGPGACSLGPLHLHLHPPGSRPSALSASLSPHTATL